LRDLPEEAYRKVNKFDGKKEAAVEKILCYSRLSMFFCVDLLWTYNNIPRPLATARMPTTP
jgi:hypothetical protein